MTDRESYSRKNTDPSRDGVARNEIKNITNANTNERAATGNSSDPSVGTIITSVVETTSAITKTNTTRSPFSRGLN